MYALHVHKNISAHYALHGVTSWLDWSDLCTIRYAMYVRNARHTRYTKQTAEIQMHGMRRRTKVHERINYRNVIPTVTSGILAIPVRATTMLCRKSLCLFLFPPFSLSLSLSRSSPFSTSTLRGNEVHPLINLSAINRRLIRHTKTYS